MSDGTLVAITGSSGHIASSVIPLLTAGGYRVKALVNKHELPFESTALEQVRGSLSDTAALEKLTEGCRVVIHCAGRISIHSDGDPLIYQTNVTGTMNMFNAALQAGVKRFIHISSIHAFDQVGTDGLLNEESPYCKETAPRYDRSKRDAQQFILKQASERMEVIVLNPTSVVGPNDFKPSLMGKAIMDIYNRKVPMLITGGFDFVDVRDVASAIISAIDRGRTGQAYLLAGRWYSLVELQDIIFRIKGENKRIPVLPACTGFLGLPFIRLLASFNGKEPLYTKESLLALIHGNKNISSRKAAEELGYTPRPFEETIRDSISWFKQAGYLQ